MLVANAIFGHCHTHLCHSIHSREASKILRKHTENLHLLDHSQLSIFHYFFFWILFYFIDILYSDYVWELNFNPVNLILSLVSAGLSSVRDQLLWRTTQVKKTQTNIVVIILGRLYEYLIYRSYFFFVYVVVWRAHEVLFNTVYFWISESVWMMMIRYCLLRSAE